MGQRFPFSTFGGGGSGSSSAGSNGVGKKSASGLKPNTAASLIDLTDGSTVETGNADAQGKITFAFSPLPGRSYVVDGQIRLDAGSGTVVAPAAPTMTLTPGNGQVSIAWTDGANGGSAITSHGLYRGTVSGSLQLVGFISTGSPYVDTGLTNGTAYIYQLSAKNGAGESVRSAEASAKPSAGSVPLTLAMFPAGSILLHDPNDAATLTLNAGKVAELRPSIGTGKFTASAQPVLSPTGGPALKPAYMSGDGVSTTGVIMTSDEAFIDSWYDGLVARRPNVDQNAVASYKTILSSGRLADNLISRLMMQRVVTDASQNIVYNTRLGDSGPIALNPFPKGSGWTLLSRWFDERDQRIYPRLSGAPALPTAQSVSGTATDTAVRMFGGVEAVSDRAALDLCLRLRANLALLPGGSAFFYLTILLDGLLSWLTAGDGSMVPAGHLFKNRMPLQSDLPLWDQSFVQLGNSIGNIVVSQAGNVIDPALGQPVYNASAGGYDSGQILTRLQNGQDSGGPALVNSGYSLSRQRNRIWGLGELVANDAGRGIPFGTMSDTVAGTTMGNIFLIIQLIETAQGVAPGQGRILLWASWRGNGNSLGGQATIDNQNDTILKVRWPTYYWDAAKALALEAGPTGSSPDPTAFAAGQISSAYRAAGPVFTASATNGVMTVTSKASGTIGNNQVLSGTGVTPGTTIQSAGTGTGDTGTYNITPSQSFASTTITAAGDGLHPNDAGGLRLFQLQRAELIRRGLITATALAA